MRITLRQLRYLDALAAESHFGRAAERCAVTQPALSAQIRELEGALGTALVERSAAGTRLTAVGEGVLLRARRILAEVGDLEDYARSATGGLAGPVRLGIIPSIAPFLLPRFLPRLGAAFPDLRLSIRETVTATLLDELADGRLDVVVASLPLRETGIEEMPLFRDAFALATPLAGPYAFARLDSPADIPAEALLLLEDGHCLRDQALASCAAIDARRLVHSGVTSLYTILQLVAAGQGVTLLPDLFLSASGSDLSGIRIVRLGDPEPHRTVGLAWRRSSALGSVYAELGRVMADLGAPV